MTHKRVVPKHARTVPNRCDSPGCSGKRAVGKYCRPCARRAANARKAALVKT